MKKKFIIAIVILIALTGLYFIFKKEKVSETTYSPYKIGRGNIQVTITATGTVKPKNRLEIKAPVAGRIDEVKIVEGQEVKKSEILAWMSSTERAAMLDAARSKGNEEYNRWSKLYLPTPILAPIDGTLILKSVEPGQTITGNDAIFVMSDVLSVKAQVDETDIAQIKKGFEAEVVLDAYPNDKIKSKVDQVAFDSSTSSSVTTYAVDVIPESIPDFMRSGMTANVTFKVQNKENILLVPSQALKIKDGQIIVLKQEGNERKEVVITTGENDGQFHELLSGLAENDEILIEDYNLDNQKNNSIKLFGAPGGNRRPSQPARSGK